MAATRWVVLAALVAATLGCSTEASGTISVRVALFGGPVTPNGRMALDNTPARNVTVTATSANGWSRTAQTDADGIATFTVAVGKYVVESTDCGQGPQPVRVASDGTAHVNIRCAVP